MRFKLPPALANAPSPHRALIEAALGPLAYAPPVLAGQVLFICFTNRCGSNYLAQILASTGRFNEAGEYFNADTVLEHAKRLKLSTLPGYFTALSGMLPHYGVLAMKISPDQLALLTETGVLDALGPLANFLLIERTDRLSQAISRVMAAQTGQFWSHQQKRAEPVYDRAGIEAEWHNTNVANALFYAFFAANGVTPLHVSYEEIVKDPTPLLNRLQATLGINIPPPDRGKITIEKQSGPLSAAWRARYLSGQ